MEPVRIGLIGCGVIGNVHANVVSESPLTQLVAVADIREEAANAVAEKHSVGKVYNHADPLIADPEVEAVILAMWAAPRTGLALQAFAKGKHVLTEKPVAINAEEVRRLIAARGELTAGCCSSRYRFLESTRAATDFVATGALGQLRVVHCRAILPAGEPPKNPPPPWRVSKPMNGGGILMNWGCYDLDYLLGVTGWQLKPKVAFAQTWPVASTYSNRVDLASDAETHFTALIRCEGDTIISYERGEFVTSRQDTAWEIIGDKGSLHLNMTASGDKEIVYDLADQDSGIVTETLWKGEDLHQTVLEGPVTDFAGAVREHLQPMTSLEQALVVQQISDAIYASAEQGTAVAVSE